MNSKEKGDGNEIWTFKAAIRWAEELACQCSMEEMSKSLNFVLIKWDKNELDVRSKFVDYKAVIKLIGLYQRLSPDHLFEIFAICYLFFGRILSCPSLAECKHFLETESFRFKKRFIVKHSEVVAVFLEKNQDFCLLCRQSIRSNLVTALKRKELRISLFEHMLLGSDDGDCRETEKIADDREDYQLRSAVNKGNLVSEPQCETIKKVLKSSDHDTVESIDQSLWRKSLSGRKRPRRLEHNMKMVLITGIPPGKKLTDKIAGVKALKWANYCHESNFPMTKIDFLVLCKSEGMYTRSSKVLTAMSLHGNLGPHIVSEEWLAAALGNVDAPSPANPLNYAPKGILGGVEVDLKNALIKRRSSTVPLLNGLKFFPTASVADAVKKLKDMLDNLGIHRVPKESADFILCGDDQTDGIHLSKFFNGVINYDFSKIIDSVANDRG